MKPSIALNQHRKAVRQVVEHNNARVFGSVMHGEALDGSDLDFLVDTTAETALLNFAKIQTRLQSLRGVPVEVLPSKR